MLNKKLHYALLCLFIVLTILSARFTINNETYSISRLIGFGAIELQIIFISLIFFVCCLLVIGYGYKKTSENFYAYVYNGNYEKAQELLKKYYKQNKTLFYKHYIFFAFATGEQKIIDEFYKKCLTTKLKRKELVCKAYKYLLDFLTNTTSSVNIESIIAAYEAKFKKNANLIYLLKAVCSLNEGDYRNAKGMTQNISRLFYYPIISVIIYKIIFESNVKLNIEHKEVLQKIQPVADNEFLRSCLKLVGI